MKPKFNIYDYDESYVMHCDTKDSAIEFLEYLDSIGLTWASGKRYSSQNMSWRGDDECYRFVAGTHSNIGYCLDAGFKVLEFDNFSFSDDPETYEITFSYESLVFENEDGE